MATTTLGVKLDEATRDRLKQAAQTLDRTPHWLIKQAIFTYLEQLDRGLTPPEHSGLAAAAGEEAVETLTEQGIQVFLEFAESILPQSVLRAAITGAYRRPETEAVPMLLEQARLPKEKADATQKLAMGIAEKLRNQKSAGGGSQTGMFGRGQATFHLFQIVEDRLFDQPVRRAIEGLGSLLQTFTGGVVEFHAKGGGGHCLSCFG